MSCWPIAAAAAAAVAACGHAAPPSRTPVPPPPPAAACFGDPDDQPLVAPLAEDAAPRPVGYRAGSTSGAGAYWYCDLPDRVVLVDGGRDGATWTGEVVSIPRAKPSALVRAPVATTSSCSDACDGPSGGFAGCSEQTTCTVHATALGPSTAVTGMPSPHPFGVIGAVGDEACAPRDQDAVIAICSTSARTIEIRVDRCEAPGTYHLAGEIYDGAAIGSGAPSRIVHGGLPTGDATSWTYTFDEPGAALSFQLGASPSARLTLDGQTDDCFAFGLDQH